MKKILKMIVYTLTLIYNSIINKIPSRHFRKWYLQLFGAKFGKKSFLFRRCEVLKPYGLKIGNNVSVGWFASLDARGGLEIGNNVNISSYVKIITGTHDIDSFDFKGVFKQVIIEDNVWICTGAIILPGVKIGKGAVVSAGAVVSKDIEPYSVVGGVPAKHIKFRNEKNCNYIVGTTTIFH